MTELVSSDEVHEDESHEDEVHELVQRWAAAERSGDIAALRAAHRKFCRNRPPRFRARQAAVAGPLQRR